MLTYLTLKHHFGLLDSSGPSSRANLSFATTVSLLSLLVSVATPSIRGGISENIPPLRSNLIGPFYTPM